MNNGYWVAIVSIVVTILLLTGWRRLLLGNIPRWIILLFVAGCAASGWLIWEAGEAVVQANVAWLLLWGLVAAAVAAKEPGASYLAFGCVLVVILWFWSGRLYAADPAIVLYKPEWDGPLLAGFAAGFLAPRFRDQFAILACALPTADLLLSISLSKTIMMGGAAWWDRFVAAAVTARLTAAVLWLIASGCSRASAHLFKNEGGRAS